jgi:hypothetical protein
MSFRRSLPEWWGTLQLASRPEAGHVETPHMGENAHTVDVPGNGFSEEERACNS